MIFRCLLFTITIVSVVRGHEWEFGTCPSVAPFAGLSVDKFLGTWYVIEQYDTNAKCLTFDYTRESETSVKVTKNRQYSVLDRAGINHTNSYTGKLDIPFAENQGFMRVKWPLNAAGKYDYVIFDTDYVNYAGVYDCQQITSFLFRQNAAILSRTPQLDAIFDERVKRRLESFKIPTADLDVIDHSDCRSPGEGKYNVGVDGDAIKNFFTDAADTLSTAAQTVIDGVQDAATYVADGVRRIGPASNSDAETVGNIKEKDTIRK